jgi:hypothetical protein
MPGSDLEEYFEIKGTPGLSLDGLTYITLGDGSVASGSIEAIIDLTGMVIPASGYFVGGTSTFSLSVPDLVATIAFENGDNVTHMLVTGFSGVKGDDADVDDDGVIDTLFWTGVVDQIALMETDPTVEGEQLYGDKIIGPDGSFAVAHAIRNESGGMTSWGMGNFGDFLTDTPGAANVASFISVADGGVQALFLDAGAANAGNAYIVLSGASGTAPGTPTGGLTLPLNYDTVMQFNIDNLNSAVFPGSLGFFGASGTGQSQVVLPPLDPSLVGIQVNTAALVIDLGTFGTTFVSGAVACDIVL